MSAERIEVKTGWIRLKIRVGMATATTWVRGNDITRISTISTPGVPGNAGTSQVELNWGRDGHILADHGTDEVIEAIKACECSTAGPLDQADSKPEPRLVADILAHGLCECDTCKIKYLQSDVTDFQSDIRYLQAINGKLCAEVEDLRGRLALARPTKEDEEAMALIRSAARELQTEKPTPDLSEGEGLQPDGSYVIKVRAGESELSLARRHPSVMRVERGGGVVVEPGPPGRHVRITSG